MKIIWNLTERVPSRGTVITVGTFDGVHRGHQEVIRGVVSDAKAMGIASAVVTFEPPPKLVFAPQEGEKIGVLTTIEEKIAVLKSLGVDYLIVANFTLVFADTPAEEFVRRDLVGRWGAKKVVVGADHMFGRGKEGTPELLERLGQELGFAVQVVPPLTIDGIPVSSTAIRRALSEGQVERAAVLLGRPYSFKGRVVEGAGWGRKLGFPTANLRPSSRYKLMPREGIYATRVQLGGRLLNSATYVGVRPTFDGTEKVAEVHIPGYSGDLYGRELEIHFYHFLRQDQKFDSPQELAEQIDLDVKQAITVLEQGGIP
ncbi:MAG: bifunctional riboflavin kinase/FAD synthetase [candidate division KSB1 bacterium]|nr:bifunctional riboflavin kinase/FAD synthetase [candidate division KSB1 bacterium]MDZ7346323.1 bifunctional riboflavin kinase/FAD synthetase [candidate division KSB1 bacterium]